MKKFRGTANVGLRDKDTDKLVVVYPEPVSSDDNNIEDKVRFWFYQQSCNAEHELESYYVDTVSEREMKER